MGFLVFPNCSFFTADFNTELEVRVGRKPFEWSVYADDSETLIPSGQGQLEFSGQSSVA